jgi:hypothetical protein
MIEGNASSFLDEEPDSPGLSWTYVAKSYGILLDYVATLGSANKAAKCVPGP